MSGRAKSRARGDSIYVLDGYWGRVSVFAPDHSFAYSFMARASGSVPPFPRAMMVPEEGSELLFAYSPGSRMVATEGAQAAVRPASPSGAMSNTLLTARPYQIA